MSEPKGDVVTGTDVVRHFLRREVRSLEANEALVKDGFDAEGVHQLRVSARRLRSEIRAMRRVLPRQPWRDLAEDLGWMGAALGALRDLDVLSDLFDEHLVAGTELNAEVRVALGRRRARREDAVADTLRSSRYARLVRQIGALAEDPGLGRRGATPAAELFMSPLWEASCAYLAAVGDPRARRSDEELHQVRIASKKCRYSFEVASFFLGDAAHRVADSLAEVQGILGDVHDRAVAVSFLDTLALGEDRDLELRRALRAQIADLRPRWPRHFDDARVAMSEVFERGGAGVAGA